MQSIAPAEIKKRLALENPWWDPPHQVGPPFDQWSRHRAYLPPFLALVRDSTVRRAVILLGPRRVGKTVLMHNAVQALLDRDERPERIHYISVDHPLYADCGLEQLLHLSVEASHIRKGKRPAYVFFDEIQYLKNWEAHLKRLVDDYPDVRFIASGSAAAALKLKSTESGAGRFTEFLLPPLTFVEFVDLLHGRTSARAWDPPIERWDWGLGIEELNALFVDYVNVGGYPEAVMSPQIRANPGRFIKSDIIDKVLLRDLPSLYGIQDIQELNALFTMLAYNTAQEVSLEQLAQKSGVAKNTIKKYIQYLEAAFLIKVVHRLDRSAKRFQRAATFKVYLMNPSMRSALFAPLGPDDDDMGHLAETAIFAQWFHTPFNVHYARWKESGIDTEVDLVILDRRQRPVFAAEVKWSDRSVRDLREVHGLIQFCQAHHLNDAWVTTRSAQTKADHLGVHLQFVPASVYCYGIGATGLAQLRTQEPGLITDLLRPDVLEPRMPDLGPHR